jgi:hypothetical protein
MYNYKCLKDYWMRNESAEKGNIPAFAEGKVYLFHLWYEAEADEDNVEVIRTEQDNTGDAHSMDLDEEFFQYFVLVD